MKRAAVAATCIVLAPGAGILAGGETAHLENVSHHSNRVHRLARDSLFDTAGLGVGALVGFLGYGRVRENRGYKRGLKENAPGQTTGQVVD